MAQTVHPLTAEPSRGPAAQALVDKARELEAENKVLKRRLVLRDALYGALADYFRDDSMTDDMLLDRLHTTLGQTKD